jgi:DNA-binding IclR family transcriptional regulator
VKDRICSGASLYGEVLERRLQVQGEPVTKIAPQLGVSRQTVYRMLNRLQHRLTDRASEGP